MKKIIIAVLVVLVLLFAGCTSTKSIYDNKSIYDDNNMTDTNDNADYSDAAKNFYPDYILPDNDNTKSLNTNIDNYFKTNNITDYKYTMADNTIKVWINNWDNMTESARTKIKNELIQINTNIKNIDFVKTKTDIQ